MKRKGIPLWVGILIISLAIAGVIALLISDIAKNNWQIDTDLLMRPAIILAGLLLSLVKLITRSGGSNKIYEKAYAKEIGNAFSRPDTKKYKNKLLSALALYNQDNYTGALKILGNLEKVCNTADDYCAVLLFKALCYTDGGSHEAAIKEYETLLKYNENHSQAWSNLGILQKKIGRNAESLKCYENAVKCDPTNAQAYNNIAQGYLADCEWEKVIEPALKALELKNNLYQADTALTVAYYALGKKEESQKHYHHAVINGANGDNITYVLSKIDNGINPFS
jgi:tetratricopeptide (TPR) repeat protein